MLNMMNFMMRLFVRKILSKLNSIPPSTSTILLHLHPFNRAQWIERLTTSQQKIHYPTAEMRIFFLHDAVTEPDGWWRCELLLFL